MSPTIVIAMPQDHDRAQAIVAALLDSDLDVYWERTAPSAAGWSDAAARVMAARASVFFWSAATSSAEAKPYRRLATRAIAAGTAICVRLDGASGRPFGPGKCTTYDLRGWRARTSSLFMLDLVAGVKMKAAGIDPPPPTAPRKLLMKRLAILVPTFIAIVAAVATFVGLYRDLGMDRIASEQEARDWAALRPGSCDDLRRFLNRHSGGVYAAQAEALLQARTMSQETRWRNVETPLPLTSVLAPDDAHSTEGAARTAALRDASAEAEGLCEGLARSGAGRLKAAHLRADRYQCERFGDDWSCFIRGSVLCRIDEPEQVQTESCGRPRN